MRNVARSLAAIGVLGALSVLTVMPFVWFESKQAHQPVLAFEDSLPPLPAERPIMPLRTRPPGPARGGPSFGRPPEFSVDHPTRPSGGASRLQTFRQPPPMRSEMEEPWIGGVVNLIPEANRQRADFLDAFPDPSFLSDY